jgi:hypothetical protein
MGEGLIVMTGNKKYFIGLSNKLGEYTLYYHMNTEMIYLSRYDNPNDAIDVLNRYTLIGTSDIIAQTIYDRIILFVENDISMREFILSMFVIFKYADTIEFQQLIKILDYADEHAGDDLIVYLNNTLISVHPGNKELSMYIAICNSLISISTTLNSHTLYDPTSNIVSDLISSIMDVFGYEIAENIQ